MGRATRTTTTTSSTRTTRAGRTATSPTATASKLASDPARRRRQRGRPDSLVLSLPLASVRRRTRLGRSVRGRGAGGARNVEPPRHVVGEAQAGYLAFK